MWILLQQWLPKRLLTECMGWLARQRGGTLTHWAIERFIARYKVDMSVAIHASPTAYDTFNAFFARPLKTGSRPVAETDWVSPVDGAVSQYGLIKRHQIFQAKGKEFSTHALLACPVEEAKVFRDGRFVTIYLSPRDYHRVHMPCDGVLRKMVYVPGKLYSVNPQTAAGIDELFAINERVVCWFDTSHGEMALVLVGATIVGSMATVWHGVVNEKRSGKTTEWHYPAHGEDAVKLKKGDEMGRFMLGSTVVLLFPADSHLRFRSRWKPDATVQMGESMAKKKVRDAD